LAREAVTVSGTDRAVENMLAHGFDSAIVLAHHISDARL
jgi:hypothetical protein